MVEENLEKFSTHENKKIVKKKFEEKAIIMHIFHSNSTIIITALLIIALSLSTLLHYTPFTRVVFFSWRKKKKGTKQRDQINIDNLFEKF